MSTREPAALDHLARARRGCRTPSSRPSPRSTRAPRCRGAARWGVRDLVEHLAGIHHWAAAQARDVAETPLATARSTSRRSTATAPRSCGTTLRRSRRTRSAPRCSAGGRPTFWHRRQLHETLVHLWDLRTAAGLPTRGRRRVSGPTPSTRSSRSCSRARSASPACRRCPSSIELVASDLEGRWRLDSTAAGDRAAAAEVRGPGRFPRPAAVGRARPRTTPRSPSPVIAPSSSTRWHSR